MKINEVFNIFDEKLKAKTNESASAGATGASNVAAVPVAMNGVQKRSAPTSLFAGGGVAMAEEDLANLCHMTPYRKKSK